ncbi:MAG: DUF3124 domain-containing protein [Planctomycetaceae bacterium]|nr:DUF3124 domain-containing protein [Planctomycetaceae bacterium]
MRQFKLLIAGFVALLVVPLIVYAFYLERRLETFEDSLRPSSPQELESDETVPGNRYPLVAHTVTGQVVYVPVYSHIYHGVGQPHLLTITLSVRNTSMEHEIVVRSMRYFDTKGREVKSYLDRPVRLPALGTTEVVVERDDASGGSGANFLVEWYARSPVTEPIIEAVMIGTSSRQGISFTGRGTVISEAASDSTEDAGSSGTPPTAE